MEVTKAQFNNPCVGCNDGNPFCCSYISIATPTYDKLIDIDALYWYLTRRETRVTFLGKKFSLKIDKWLLQIMLPCRHLQDGGLCAIYKDRPAVCSDHSAFPKAKRKEEYCERYGDEHDNEIVFTNSEKFLVFMQEKAGWHPDKDREQYTFNKKIIKVK